jgi:hypothetical protein
MIGLFILFLLLCPVVTWASVEEEQNQAGSADTLRPLQALSDEIISESYLESAFQWRKKSILASAELGQPIELNNFTSNRFGLLAEFPTGSILVGGEFAYVITRSSASSLLLEETPIRQAGRPSRFEAGAIIEVPLAEGLANQVLSILPAAQMLWSLQIRMRKIYYDGMYKNQKGLALVREIFSASMSESSRENLKPLRLPGMNIAQNTLDLLIGLKSTVFHKSGFFVSPSFLISPPLWAGDKSKSLGFWWEMAIGCGYAF